MSREKDFDERDLAKIITQSPKFKLGRMLITSGAQEVLTQREVNIAIARHQRGDWGDHGEEDKKVNDLALEHGECLLSVYHARGTKFWIITEWDRSSTTILLPNEY